MVQITIKDLESGESRVLTTNAAIIGFLSERGEAIKTTMAVKDEEALLKLPMVAYYMTVSVHKYLENCMDQNVITN